MSHELELRREGQESRSPIEAPAESGPACHGNGTGWLKGGLTMAVCCAAPLLLVMGIASFGLSLGAIASGALSLAALLACPIGMFLMMRTMMKDKK
jgi:hypothetical protein